MREVSSDLEAIVGRAIAAGVFPDASVVAQRRAVASGFFSTAKERVFDLASLTKPFVATIAARLVATGALSLQAPVGDLLPGCGAVGSANVVHLLAHRAGLAAWTPYYRTLAGEDVLRAAMAEPLECEPGARENYSDVGYLLLGSILERISGLSLDRLLAVEVLVPLGISDVQFGPVASEWALPTEDCPWRGEVLCGIVHDENAHAFGRPAGHAGLFGRAAGVARLGAAWIAARSGEIDFLPRAIATTFTTALPGGTHAPAWDTKSAEGSSAGSRLGPRSFGHLGFTGTSIWCDPDAEAVIVLLSNRVHPSRDNVAIRELRPRFHDEVASLLGI